MSGNVERTGGRLSTVRPSVLLVSSLLQEPPPGSLKHGIALEGSESLELGSQRVQEPSAERRTLDWS